MKTNDLIAMLSTNTEPVDRTLVVRTVCIAPRCGPERGTRQHLHPIFPGYADRRRDAHNHDQHRHRQYGAG